MKENNYTVTFTFSVTATNESEACRLAHEKIVNNDYDSANVEIDLEEKHVNQIIIK